MSWLKTVWQTLTAREAAIDPQVIGIVELAVSAIDPRLRAVPNYQKKLAPAAKIAFDHICTVTRHLPEPVLATREYWSANPLLRALFPTPDDIDPLFDENADLKAWSESPDTKHEIECIALLTATRSMQTRAITVANGDSLTRDVNVEVAVFNDRRVVAPSRTPHELRLQLKQRMLDQLFQHALEDIDAILASRRELEEQRAMLQARLQLLQQKKGSMSDLLTGNTSSESTNLAAKLEDNADRLLKNFQTLDALEDYLAIIDKLLRQAPELLRVERVKLRLNRMNVVVDANSPDEADTLELIECHIARQPPLSLVVCPVRHPTDRIEAPYCRLDQAERFL